MRDIPIRGKGRYKFDRCIAHHHIFSLERNGRNQEHNSLVRIEHAKRKEHAVASAGSADRSPRIEIGTHRHDRHTRIYDCVVLESFDVILAQLPRFLTKAGADAADKVVDQEALEAQNKCDRPSWRNIYVTSCHGLKSSAKMKWRPNICDKSAMPRCCNTYCASKTMLLMINRFFVMGGVC